MSLYQKFIIKSGVWTFVQLSDDELTGLFQVEKGKVILTLPKASEGSWAVQLSQRGLEQQSDEEED